MHKTHFPLLIALAACSACECIPHAPAARPVIRIPRSAGPTLATGIPLKVLDDTVLSRMVPSQPSSHVQFWAEFKYAPQMKMINAPGGLTAVMNDTLSAITGDSFAPLEVDTAVCGTGPHGAPLPRLPDGTWEPPAFDLAVPGVSNDTIHLQRVKATIATLRTLAPATAMPNSVRVVLSLRDVEATIIEDIRAASSSASTTTPEHVVKIAAVDIDCDVVPVGSGVVNGCGEVSVACMPNDTPGMPGVSLTGIDGFLAGVSIVPFGNWLQTELRTRLMTGARLHFEGFSVSAFTVNPSFLTLAVTGALSNSCSWVPPPPPDEPAPLRGITRLRPQQGEGELVSDTGKVKPYHLVPEVEVSWLDRQTSEFAALQPWRELYAYTITGNELSRMNPDGGHALHDPHRMALGAQVELVRSTPNPCWQEPTSIELLDKQLVEFETFQTCANCGCTGCFDGAFLETELGNGSASFTRELADVQSGPIALLGQKDVSVDEARNVIKNAFGDDVCPGPDCTGWSRFDLVPSGPRDPLGPESIVHYRLWLRDDLRLPADILKFDDPRTCKFENTREDRRYIEPAVVFGRFQVDSAELQSGQVAVGNRDQMVFEMHGLSTETVNAAARTQVNDPEGAVSIRIDLKDCPAHGRGGKHLSKPCWSGEFRLPTPLDLSVSGFSATTLPRLPFDSTMFTANGSAGASTLFGMGNFASQGTFDRSGLRLYTNVPQIYRDLGVTTKAQDFREVRFSSAATPWHTPMMFDWMHDATFLPPATSITHPGLAQSRWVEHGVSWFASWNQDVVAVKWVGDVPPSFCLDPSQVFATPTTVSYIGGGWGLPHTGPAVDLFTVSTMINGEVRVNQADDAAGWLRDLAP